MERATLSGEMEVIGYLGVIDYIAIVTVLTISAGVGVYFGFSGGKQKTTDEFLMAGRGMSAFPVIFSLVVTFVSAIMMLGTPAEIYRFGSYRIISYLSNSVSSVCSAYLFLPVYFQMGTSVSIYEYLERRFGKTARNVTSVLFILQTVFYVAVVLYAPSLALNAVITTLPTWASIITIGTVCTFYCSLGGLKAVLWTDVFQSFIMYTTMFAIFGAGIGAVGGFWEVLRRAHEGGRLEISNFSTSLTDRYTVWNCIAFGFLNGLGNYGCNQAQVQRMLCVKNLKKSQKAVLMSVPLAIIFTVANLMVGIVLYANFYDCDPLKIPEISKLTNGDQLVPYFILRELSKVPGLAGICVAGIFSGSLSSVSSAVNSLSAVTMEDFVRPYVPCEKLTEKRSALLVKVFVFSYGFIGVALAFFVAKIGGIVKAVSMLFGTVAGPVLGIFTLGMMTVSANEKGAVTGIIAGFAATISLVINNLLNGSNHASLPTTIEGCFSDANITLIDPLMSILNQNNTYQVPNFNNTKLYSFTNMNSSQLMSSDTLVPTLRKSAGDISFMWFITVGFVVTVFVGYVASLITDRKTQREVDPILISTPMRKWLIKTLPQTVIAENKEMKKF